MKYSLSVQSDYQYHEYNGFIRSTQQIETKIDYHVADFFLRWIKVGRSRSFMKVKVSLKMKQLAYYTRCKPSPFKKVTDHLLTIVE